jgi:hypothetical protein
MPGDMLTTNSTIQCMHGGSATLQTSNAKVSAEGGNVLLETDVHTVTGCPFTLPGPKPSPCVTIRWTAVQTSCTVNGIPVLIKTSVGIGYSPESAPQGKVVIANTQMKASAR